MKTSKSPIQVIAGAAKTPEYTPAAVKALMKRLDMNERAFALLMNVSPLTVRMWITGAARPCNLARRLMQIYGAGPDVVSKFIIDKED